MNTFTLSNGSQSYVSTSLPVYDPAFRFWRCEGASGEAFNVVDVSGAEYTLTSDTAIPLIGPIAFQMLFSIQEAVAIDAAKETDPAVRIFWKLLDDPRTDIVDRNLQPIQDMIMHLEDVKLLAEGRAKQIIYAE